MPADADAAAAADPDPAAARARRRALRDVPPGTKIHETFLVQRAEARQAKSGAHYLVIVLRDAAGLLDARLFDAKPQAVGDFVPGEPVRLAGKIEQYHNAPQLVIDRYHKPSTIKWGELVAASRFEPRALLDEVRRILGTIQNPHLAAVRDAYFADQQYMERFERVPAAVRSHHAWRHGLLEHVVSALRLADALCAHYRWLDRDLVLLAVFLHDSGKAFAIDEHLGEVDYTTMGRLLGNATLGVTYLDRKLQQLGSVPQLLGIKLRHCVLAHQGQGHWGAPQPPMTPEALVVHHIDALDSALGALRELEAQPAEDGETAAAASPFRYSALLRRRVSVEPHAADPDAEPPQPTVQPDEAEPEPGPES